MELAGSWVLGILKNWMGLFLTYQQMRKSVLGSVVLTQIYTNLLFCSFREEKGPTFTSGKSHLFSQRVVHILGSNAIRPAGQRKTQTVSLQLMVFGVTAFLKVPSTSPVAHHSTTTGLSQTDCSST